MIVLRNEYIEASIAERGAICMPGAMVRKKG